MKKMNNQVLRIKKRSVGGRVCANGRQGELRKMRDFFKKKGREKMRDEKERSSLKRKEKSEVRSPGNNREKRKRFLQKKAAE